MTATDIEPGFKAWRRETGLTQAEAAEALKVSLSHIKNWERGTNRTNGDRSVPPYAVRVLMSLIACGIDIEPWDE